MIKYDITSQIVELAPGQNTTVVLTITNESQIIDDFTVSFQPSITPETVGLNPAWLNLTPTQFPLRPIAAGRGPVLNESQREVKLILTLPPQVEAGNYAGLIFIRAKSGRDNSAQLAFNLVVSEREAQLLEIQPKEQTSRRRTEIYRVTLVNEGNTPHLYSVYAEDDRDDCLFEMKPAEVTLLPNEQAALTLRVRPRRRNWTDADRRYPFRVKLEGLSDQFDGAFIQRCALPPIRWMQQHWMRLAFVFAVLVALLIAAFVFFLPSLVRAEKSAYCGPFSERYLSVTSDNLTTEIRVSGRAGNDNGTLSIKVQADAMPGLFSSLVSVSPDGRRLVYVTAKNLALDDAHLIVVDLLNFDPARGPNVVVNLAVPNGLWPTAPVWSSNGEKIAFLKRPELKAGAIVAAPTPTSAATAGAGATGAAGTSPTIAAPAPTDAATTAGPNGAGLAPGQLELWMADLNTKEAPKKALAVPTRLTTDLFYGIGNHDPNSPVICWASDDQSLLIRPRPEDKTTKTQLQVPLADGTKPEEISLKPLVPFVSLPTGAGQGSLPRAALLLPAASLLPAPRSGPVVAPVSANASDCPITKPYSQNDPRWSNLLLKDGNASKLGEWGCPIVAGAILLSYESQDKTPAELNDCLAKGGFTIPLTEDGWTAVGELCGGSRQTNRLSDGFAWDKLDTALQKGPAIVRLIGGPAGLHFLVVNSGHDGDAATYGVVDPWDGTTDKTLADFIGWGYRPNGLLSYDAGQGKSGCGVGSEASPRPARNGQPDPRQTASGVKITISGPTDGGMYKEAQTFQYSVSGAASASATISLTTRGGGLLTVAQNNPPDAATPLNEEGIYAINIGARDKNDLLLATRRVYFTIDRTAPMITPLPSPNPIDPQNNRFDKPMRLQFQARDALTGISLVEYSVDGSPWQIYSSDTTTEPRPFDKPGAHTVQYRATDGAGNSSEALPYTFSIVPPGSVTPPPPSTAAAPGQSGQPLTPLVPATVKTLAPLIPGQVIPGQPGQPGVAAIPTATPRPAQPPAVVSTATPTLPVPGLTPGVGGQPTTAPVTTLRPTTLAATTAAVTTSAITPSPTTGPTPTVTPVPRVALSFDNTTLNFGPGVSSQTLQIKNTGNTPTTWLLTPGNSASLLSFSSTTGYLAPGDAVVVTINTSVAASQSSQNLTTSFVVSATGTNGQTINVTIQPKPLPSASFSNAPSGALPITLTLTLAIVSSPQTQTADHALIIATYKRCDSCTPSDTPLGRIAASGSGTLVWDTTQILPQDGISLSGKICASTDESNCAAIPAITGLSIAMNATISNPTASAILTDTTRIVVQPTGRASRVIFSYTSSDGTVQSNFAQASAATGWQVTWNSLLLTPNLQPTGPANTVTLSANVCNGLDATAFCRAIPAVTGLSTIMTGTVVTTPDLTQAANLALGNSVAISVTGLTSNINHVSIVATYRDNNATAATAHILTKLTGPAVYNWDFSTLYAQTGMSLELRDCFRADESLCGRLALYSNLQIPLGPPATIEAPTTYQTTAINTAFSTPFKVVVRDARKSPVPGVVVQFFVPCVYYPYSQYYACGTFSGGLGTVNVTTDATGAATPPIFAATGVAGSYYINVSTSGAPSALIRLINNSPNLNNFQLYYDNQHAKILTNFTYPLYVQALDKNYNYISGTVVYFQILNGSGQPGATFYSGATPVSYAQATTNQYGLASTSAYNLTANGTNGIFQVQVSAYNFNQTVFTLTNDKGTADATLTTVTPASIPRLDVDANFPALTIMIKDAGGNPLQGITPTFSATTATGGGTLSTTFGGTAPTASDAAGKVVVPAGYLKANGSCGTYNLNIGLGTTTKTVSVTQIGPATAITANPAVNASALAGAAYSPATLSAKVTDACGNPVKNGTQVTFNAPGTGASGDFGGNGNSIVVNTTTGGIATTTGTFTANAQIGSYEVTANVNGTSITTAANSFRFTNTANVAITGGDGQTILVGGASTVYPLVLKVTGSGGTGIDGVPVVFSVTTANGGTVNTSNTNTAGGGVASTYFTSGSQTGVITVNAAVQLATGTVNKTFTVYNNVKLAVLNGNTQTTANGTAFATPLSVKALDNNNNPVGVTGLSVTFSIQGSSGATFKQGATDLGATTTITADATTGQADLNVTTPQTLLVAGTGPTALQIVATGVFNGINAEPFTFIEAVT